MLTGKWKGGGAATGPNPIGFPPKYAEYDEEMVFSRPARIINDREGIDGYTISYDQLVERGGVDFHIEAGFFSLGRGRDSNVEVLKMLSTDRAAIVVSPGVVSEDNGVGHMYHLEFRGQSESANPAAVMHDKDVYLDYYFDIRFNSTHLQYRQELVFKDIPGREPPEKQTMFTHYQYSLMFKEGS